MPRRTILRAAARRIGTAGSVAGFEDLGVQQAPNSTLCSYLNKLLWILTGSFAKRGGQHLHSAFAPLFRYGGVGRTPVTGAPIISGLMPSNVVPQEILTDHPDRFEERATFEFVEQVGADVARSDQRAFDFLGHVDSLLGLGLLTRTGR